MKLISVKKTATVLLGILFSLNVFSQAFNVQSAADAYSGKGISSKNKLKNLSDAKNYIDLAAANEQTSNDPKMWRYRGLIYLAIDQDTSEAARQLDPDANEKSAVSFINCFKTDTKKNFEEDCNRNIWVAGVRLYNKASKALNSGDYEKATRYFNLTLDILPYDKDNNLKQNTITANIINYNLAKTAIKAKDNAKAKNYLQKLMDIKYNDPMIYLYMERVFLDEKDTTQALSYIEQGRKIFDENTSLLNEEIRIYSLQGKFDALITKFTDAINLNDGNEVLYYNRATLYENKRDLVNAESDYKKAIELKPDYFDANYGLGIMYFNQAADLANAANGIKNNDEFDKAKKKYELKFKEAEPYLEKAMELNPKKTDEDQKLYRGTVNSLKQLYARTGEMEKYNKMKSLLEQK